MSAQIIRAKEATIRVFVDGRELTSVGVLSDVTFRRDATSSATHRARLASWLYFALGLRRRPEYAPSCVAPIYFKGISRRSR